MCLCMENYLTHLGQAINELCFQLIIESPISRSRGKFYLFTTAQMSVAQNGQND